MMEAVALWEWVPVRGVACAHGADAICARAFWNAVGMDHGGALYSLDLAGSEPPKGPALSERLPEVNGYDDVARAAERVVARSAGRVESQPLARSRSPYFTEMSTLVD
jgi:hypothetical protein